jgi:hypothetical protein
LGAIVTIGPNFPIKKKSYTMQLFNLWLYAINCYLQLCFVIFTISHHHLQSIIMIVIMVQVIVIIKCFILPCWLFFGLFIQEEASISINCKKIHNLLTSMYCTYTFDVHYNFFGYIMVYL